MESVVERVLRRYRRWAVVGCSPDPRRDSHDVAAFLLSRGYQIVPVNPGCDEILGQPCYPTLHAIPGPVDVVDIFRRSELAGAHVDEAIDIGARAVWMQLGVVDEAAAERAERAGLDVVMDRCPKIELPQLDRAGR